MKADDIKELTKKLYSGGYEIEWGRLIRDPYHKLEFSAHAYGLVSNQR